MIRFKQSLPNNTFRLHLLCVIIVSLTGGWLASAVAAPHPLLRDGTHFCGVDHYQPRRRRPDSKGVDARNYAARNLNVGQPRTVRMIYFLPNDRPYQAEVVQRMKDEIRTVQTFFADQMEAHGYGRATFRLETDAQGEPIVHRVDGRHPDSHYLDDTHVVYDELREAFNYDVNIYLTVVDNSLNGIGYGGGEIAGGTGGRRTKQGGEALVSESLGWGLVAHELGHAFGLHHDFRDGAYIMSYGPGWNGLSQCHAENLSVHSYFNRNIPLEAGEPPTIELISPIRYRPDSAHVSVRLRVNDSNGLHQVILHASQPDNRSSVKACRGVRGSSKRVIEFDYDGVIPSAHDPFYSEGTSLLNPLVHPIKIEAADIDGNVASSMEGTAFRFVLFSEALEPLTKISGDNQAGLPNTALPVPFVVEVRDLNDGFAAREIPITFSVTEGGGRLSVEHTETDRSGRAESTLTLGPNFGRNTVLVTAAGIGEVTFNAVGVPPIDIPDPNLRAAIEDALSVSPGTPIAPADMGSLTRLEASEAGIKNLTGLEYATNLTSLDFWKNSVSDLSPVAGLTQLKFLGFASNRNISDVSALAGLTNLTDLFLNGNAISDISPLQNLTNLNRLSLSYNSISDISDLAGLTDLTWLKLDRNAITDISALENLTNLRHLVLYINKISDPSPVAGLTNLTYLNLAENSISGISALTDLTNLIHLELPFNSISDLSPLVANTELGEGAEVDVRGNPLTYASIKDHIPALQGRGVTVEFDTRRVERLLKISGDNQQGPVGEVLTDPFVVEVRDENGAVFAEVPVTFTVTDGSGTLSVTNTTTDENGRAQSTLTLGPDFGLNTVLVSAAGTEAQVIFTASPLTSEYLWSIPAGISLIHVPLKVTAVDGGAVDAEATTIKSIGDLYTALGGARFVTYLATHAPGTEEEWLVYVRDSQRDTDADRALTDDMAIVANLITPVSVLLTGSALGTDDSSTITLTPGLNYVGLPLRDEKINRMSDLLRLDGIWGNVSLITSHWGNESNQVRQPGDDGDIAITGGQGFMLVAQQPATVTISGEAWTNEPAAVSPAAYRGIEVRDTTPVLALRGAVVDERTGAHADGFRVIAKNLSTNSAVTALTAPDEAGYRDWEIPPTEELNEAGYRLIVVDIETGQAATIGDTLEISAQSPDPFIGVKPLRYTVTAEDVRRSLIELPELVAYEIPRETELLANYPNPFNPETWIPYRLAEDAFVTLTIYDSKGRVVRTLEVGHRIAAVYESRSKAIYWDGRNEFGETVASGIYFYQLQAEDYSATRKAVILK